MGIISSSLNTSMKPESVNKADALEKKFEAKKSKTIKLAKKAAKLAAAATIVAAAIFILAGSSIGVVPAIGLCVAAGVLAVSGGVGISKSLDAMSINRDLNAIKNFNEMTKNENHSLEDFNKLLYESIASVTGKELDTFFELLIDHINEETNADLAGEKAAALLLFSMDRHHYTNIDKVVKLCCEKTDRHILLKMSVLISENRVPNIDVPENYRANISNKLEQGYIDKEINSIEDDNPAIKNKLINILRLESTGDSDNAKKEAKELMKQSVLNNDCLNYPNLFEKTMNYVSMLCPDEEKRDLIQDIEDKKDRFPINTPELMIRILNKKYE